MIREVFEVVRAVVSATRRGETIVVRHHDDDALSIKELETAVRVMGEDERMLTAHQTMLTSRLKEAQKVNNILSSDLAVARARIRLLEAVQTTQVVDNRGEKDDAED